MGEENEIGYRTNEITNAVWEKREVYVVLRMYLERLSTSIEIERNGEMEERLSTSRSASPRF